MTVDSLIASLREANIADLEVRAAHTNSLAELRGAEAKGETVLEADVQKLRGAKTEIDARVALRSARIDQLNADAASDAAAQKLSAEVRSTGLVVPASTSPGRVTGEERTYHKGNDPKGQRFLSDVAAAAMGDWDARERTAKHQREERVEGRLSERATSTGSFVGLTVPQYLTDMFAPNAKAMRPFAETMRTLPLPGQGMVVNISRITTGSSAALQATQNSAVSNQDIADTLLTIPVQTMAAQQVMSRQALERSTGAEAVTLDDMIRQYYTQLDSTLLNQAVTGLSAVANRVAYQGANTTPATYAKLLQGRSQLEGVLLDTQAGDEIAIMHSRRWAAIQSASSTTNFPFVTPVYSGPVGQGGQDYGLNYGPGFRGQFGGLNVVVDNNVTVAGTDGGSTASDEIYVVNRRETILWEDASAPVMIRAEQTNAASLGVLFVVYGYFAYTHSRYQSGGFAAHQKLSGTALQAPTFDGTGA